VSATLVDRPDLDTWLARLLLREGRLPQQALQILLAEARRARPQGGPTLAQSLIARGVFDRPALEELLRSNVLAETRIEGPPPGPAPRRLGAFELLEELGAGGMGVVHVARHVETGARYALKTLTVPDLEAVERFRREGEGQARVDAHPNVVRVHALDRQGGTCYLVMDLADGGSLHDLLKRGLPDPDQAARWVRDLAGAVQHAHEQGVLHRDLKPHNILFHGGVPMVVDFGLAKLVDARSLTATGTILGTPAYMAPEQVDGSQGKVGPPADVYGLGAILYRCLAGRPPCQGGSVMQTMLAVLEEAPPRPTDLVPTVPPALEEICLRALAKASAQRYPTAAALGQALDAYLAGDLQRPAGRPGRLLVAAGLLLVGLAVSLALAIHDPAVITPAEVSGTPAAPPAGEAPRDDSPAKGAPSRTAPDEQWRNPASPEQNALYRKARTRDQLRQFEAAVLTLRHLVERTNPPSAVQAQAAGFLARLHRMTEVADSGEALLWAQRGVLMGDADSAASLAMAYMDDEPHRIVLLSSLPVEADLNLARACATLATTWPGAEEGLKATAANALERMGPVDGYDEYAAYACLWEAWSPVMDGITTPSAPHLDYLLLPGDSLDTELTELLQAARDVPEEDGARAAQILDRVLATPPSPAHPPANVLMARLAFYTPEGDRPHLRRALLQGEPEAAANLTAHLLEDAQLPADPLLGLLRDKQGRRDNVLAAACVSFGLLDPRRANEVEPARVALEAAGYTLPSRWDAYRRLWTAFPDAR
jgi:Protein kinase domain